MVRGEERRAARLPAPGAASVPGALASAVRSSCTETAYNWHPVSETGSGAVGRQACARVGQDRAMCCPASRSRGTARRAPRRALLRSGLLGSALGLTALQRLGRSRPSSQICLKSLLRDTAGIVKRGCLHVRRQL